MLVERSAAQLYASPAELTMSSALASAGLKFRFDLSIYARNVM